MPEIPIPSQIEGASASLTFPDGPDGRAALETMAIPRCAQWRDENPEAEQPAPYCCSAYCLRCAGLRHLDGVDALSPNEWMDHD